MSTIIIVPFARKKFDGTTNPKTYPFWNEVIEQLQSKYHLVQVGERGEDKLVQDVRFNLSQKEHKKLLSEALTFMSVDTWYPHFAHKQGKPGVVIWGKSNPRIFGYETHFNIYKDTRYFRKEQFRVWNDEPYDVSVFLEPSKVIEAVETCVRFLTQN